MPVPDELKSAIDSLLENAPRHALSKAAADLSNRYRSPDRDRCLQFMDSPEHRLAYLAVRMPATFAVVRRVLEECKDRIPNLSPASIADIGAGPGTAAWAAVDVFPGISQIDLYEKDDALIDIGASLMKRSGALSLQTAQWHKHDLLGGEVAKKHNLSLLSYVAGELPLDAALRIIEHIWATTQLLVIIEPGTPHGFKRIIAFRERLLQLGAFLVAPCPHHRACPMQGTDWCHFAVRLERSALHREVKSVSMGYEDEKYSYIVASKLPVALPEARIMRHPNRHSGHIDFLLCGQTGLEKKVVSKKMGDFYKKARKLDWGDSFECSP